MKQMNKKVALLDGILSELCEIKLHLCNQRQFEGGVGLGALIRDLFNKIDEAKEDDDDEDEEEEYDDDEDRDYEKEDCYEALKETNKKIKNLEEELCQKINQVTAIKDIIKDLIKNDHIYPGKIDHVITALSSCCKEEKEENLWNLQSGTTMKFKA